MNDVDGSFAKIFYKIIRNALGDRPGGYPISTSVARTPPGIGDFVVFLDTRKRSKGLPDASIRMGLLERHFKAEHFAQYAVMGDDHNAIGPSTDAYFELKLEGGEWRTNPRFRFLENLIIQTDEGKS